MDLYPLKAQFMRGEKIKLALEWDGLLPARVLLGIFSLDKCIHQEEILLTEDSSDENQVGQEGKKSIKVTEHQAVEFAIDGFDTAMSGYGVEIYRLGSGADLPDVSRAVAQEREDVCPGKRTTGLPQNEGEKEGELVLQTAFDVVDSPRKCLRYGFVSDFREEDADHGAMLWLLKCHINLVQFYDWSYRHDQLLAPEIEGTESNGLRCSGNYTDMMGKEINAATVEDKIVRTKEYGMHPMAYGAVYAASKDFFISHPDWGFYNSSGKPFVFIDVFYIMNLVKGSPWRKHLIEEYRKAVAIMGFDGIHMDTYGFPKTAFSHLSAKPQLVRLEESLPSLIDETRQELGEGAYLVFNNVGAWPVDETAGCRQDAVYMEIWPPYERYAHIAELIRRAKRASGGNKSVILAAYLKPFREEVREQALAAARLLMGAIVSCGASHLLTGENQAVLTQGYYSDYVKLEAVEADCLRRYYDFMVRYEELFYDPQLCDVSMTHTGWDNFEYCCTSHRVSSYGEAGKVWMIIRESERRKCIYLVNLCGQREDYWNRGKQTPEGQRNIEFRIQVDSRPVGAWWASPDGISDGTDSSCSNAVDMRARNLSFTETEEAMGRFVSLTLPRLGYWTVIWLDFVDG